MMTNVDAREGFFYSTLTQIMDSFSCLPLNILFYFNIIIPEGIITIKSMNCIHSFSNFRPWAFFSQWTVNIYHNSHHGCYLPVKFVSNILKKAQGRKFEKE